MSWRRFCKTSWRHLGETYWRRLGVLKTFSKRLEDVLKMSWRRFPKTSWRSLKNVPKTLLQDVLKTSWKRLEDVWPRRIHWSWPRRLENVSKTSSENVWLRWISLENVLKTSSGDENERRLQDVFIKTDVCWVIVECSKKCINFKRESVSKITFLKVGSICDIFEQVPENNRDELWRIHLNSSIISL